MNIHLKSPQMKKFTLRQIKRKVGVEDKELIEKVFLLANGMIDVHGYDSEQAFQKALDIGLSWRENGGKYKKNKNKL